MTIPRHIETLADHLEEHEQMKASALAVAAKAQAPLAAATPMELLDRAVSGGASVEVLERLMGLQERFDANQARKAFDAAIAAAKAELPVIVKAQEKTGAGGTYRYEDLAGIAKQIDPILAHHGLSYRFRSESNGYVKVTCVISHRDGHSEENSLSSPPDATGSKNAIQAIGSAVTYLQRYTLKAALGLAASKDDDGGAYGNGAVVNDDQVKTIMALIQEVNADTIKLCKYFQVAALTEIPASKYDNVIAALESKRKKAAAE